MYFRVFSQSSKEGETTNFLQVAVTSSTRQSNNFSCKCLQVHWQRPQIHRLHHLFRVLGCVVESLYRFLLGMDVGKVKVDDADRTQLVYA